MNPITKSKIIEIKQLEKTKKELEGELYGLLQQCKNKREEIKKISENIKKKWASYHINRRESNAKT